MTLREMRWKLNYLASTTWINIQKQKFCVGVCAVDVNVDNESIHSKTDIINEKNVRESFKMVKIEEIKTYHFNIYYSTYNSRPSMLVFACSCS